MGSPNWSAGGMASLVVLEALIYFNKWYTMFWTVLNLLIFFYKGRTFPYPPDVLGWEVTCVVLYALIDRARCLLGSRGNKTEQKGPIAFFILLTLPCLIGNVYFHSFQIYVLQIDQSLNVMPFVLLGLQMPLALYAAIAPPKGQFKM